MQKISSRTIATISVVIAVLAVIGATALFSMRNTEREELLPGNIVTTGTDEGVSLGLDARPFMPEGYSGTSTPNLEPPTTTVEYRDPAVGLSFNVPYNPAWGNDEYQAQPYLIVKRNEAPKTIIQFGPSFPFEGGGWARGTSLFVEAASGTEDVITYIKKTERAFLEDRPIETLKIDDKTAVVYYSGGLCSYVNIWVIGKKANYWLRPTCGDEEIVREGLVEVVRSMKFIEE